MLVQHRVHRGYRAFHTLPRRRRHWVYCEPLMTPSSCTHQRSGSHELPWFPIHQFRQTAKGDTQPHVHLRAVHPDAQGGSRGNRGTVGTESTCSLPTSPTPSDRCRHNTR